MVKSKGALLYPLTTLPVATHIAKPSLMFCTMPKRLTIPVYVTEMTFGATVKNAIMRMFAWVAVRGLRIVPWVRRGIIHTVFTEPWNMKSVDFMSS
jgi:hypothetical protein